VLENIARIDAPWCSVRCQPARLRRLLHTIPPKTFESHGEGGRTTAAIAASRYGTVLKISEDA